MFLFPRNDIHFGLAESVEEATRDPGVVFPG